MDKVERRHHGEGVWPAEADGTCAEAAPQHQHCQGGPAGSCEERALAGSLGKGEDSQLQRGCGPWTPAALSSGPCLQIKWNLRLFQAEQRPERGCKAFLCPLHHLASYTESFLKFVRVATFSPLLPLPIYFQYTPLPCLVYSSLHLPFFMHHNCWLYSCFSYFPLLPWICFSLCLLNLETRCLSLCVQTP